MKSRSRRFATAAVVVGLLSAADVRAQRVLISEFLAQNDGTVVDEDGEFSDWLELHNADSLPVDIDGWYLTDDPGELTKWRIPQIVLQPGEFLVIFCTGNDRRDPASELHTNFKLTSEGEFLALVRPDGVSIAQQFTPQYPFQFPDLSYGLDQDRTTTTLIAEGAASSAWVPGSDVLGEEWKKPGFSEVGWRQGATGVGFDTGTDYGALLGTDIETSMHGRNASAYIRVPFTAKDPSAFDGMVLRMKYDDGFVAYINEREVARRNAPSVLSWDSSATAEHGQPRTGTLSQDFDGGGTGYVLTAHGANFPPRILSGGPTGRYLELMRDDTGSLTNTIGFDRVFGAAESVRARFDFRMPVEAGHTGCCGERADGFGFALIDTAVYGNSGPGPSAANVVWERPRFPGTFAVGFDIFNGSGTENTVSLNWNGIEVAARLVGGFPLNNGVFNRCEVEIIRDGDNSLVTVTITPDSLGASPGSPVVVFDAQRIAGMAPFSNRAAFGGRTGGAFVSLDLDNIEIGYSTSVSQQIAWEEIDLRDHADALRSGPNVLAVHGLNRFASDGDFLILPELEAYETGTIRTGIYHYFTEPTPGEVNFGGVPGFAEPARFSREAGGFPSAFDLSLSVFSPDAVIRYTLNRSEPTASSAAYTGPIRLSGTTVVKAKTFEEGLLPSPTVTKTYVRVSTDMRNFTSNLPIVLVDTFGQGISDGAQTPAYAVFIDTDETTGRAAVTDVPDFQGSSGIKYRGSSSLGFAKKMFAFETWDAFGNDLSVSILGFPREADWILNGPYSDKSLMRNVLSYQWSNDIKRYAVRTQFVEMFLNRGSGMSYADYHGVYVFMEKIKRDEARVDIQKLLPSQNSEPEISGGYIIKKDRLDPGDSGFLTSRGQRLAYVEPKEREITSAQASWLRNYLNAFEAALYGASFRDPDTGYARYIDVDSFIDHHIIVELTKNIDGFRLSTFWFKDRGGKLHMGPVWDYNLCLGNANYLEGWLSTGWYNRLISQDQYPYFSRLFQDPDFLQRYIDRWTALRRTKFRESRLLGDVDSTAAYLSESQVRNFQRWPVLGTYVWPNWFIANTYAEEINWMKGWIRGRLEWYDGNYLQAPAFSQDGGLIEPGFQLFLSAPAGTVYYTLDGSDPRLPGGGVSPTAVPYGSAPGTELVSASSEVRVMIPADGGLGTGWTSPSFNDGAWRRGTGGAGVGYERGSGYQGYIDVDVLADMDGVNTSAYIRFPFTVDDPGALETLTLRMRYDDGFVAYLNGARIASANDPASLGWNAVATTLHDDAAAVQFETWDVSAHIPSLRSGTNVLAVHGLNESLTSSDFLIEPELTASAPLEGDAVVLNGPTRVIARARQGGQWSGLSEAIFVLESDLPLRVTEVMYHPRDLPEGSPFRGGDLEFVELRNISNFAVSLAGVRFTDGILFDFTDSDVRTLGAGGFVVVVRDRQAFEWYYGRGLPVAGQYENVLDNGGETIHIVDGTGESIHQFRYDDAWYPETDGGGYALVIKDPLAEPQTWGLSSSWEAGGVLDGTPGEPDGDPGPLRGFQRPGDSNQDGVLDLSDSISLLRLLFSSGSPSLPCDGSSLEDGGNLTVLDLNGDANVDLSDAIYLLSYLFLDGPPAAMGTDCVRLEGCPNACIN